MDDLNSFGELLDHRSLELLTTSGPKLIQSIGLNSVREIVGDVLSGRNLRDSTELLTRGRLATLNAALLRLFLEGERRQSDFIQKIPEHAERILARGRLTKAEKWIAQWMLGLTDKASQNVLRDDASLLSEYRRQYELVCGNAIRMAVNDHGDLKGTLSLGPQLTSAVTWQFLIYLMSAVGAQTLTIRGSEKSAYGKLFERLILGSLLSILGFTYREAGTASTFQREFWLSSRDEKRESDATALWQAGKGARFDIGFIGRGNPEISLDKITRFDREIQLGRSTWYMATIIIVDRIGAKSRIPELAKMIDGDIVQMSMAYWPQEVAKLLRDRMGFTHPLVSMKQTEVGPYLRGELAKVNLMQFIQVELDANSTADEETD